MILAAVLIFPCCFYLGSDMLMQNMWQKQTGMNLNKPAGAFFILYLFPVLTLLYIIGPNNLLDANFSVDELARQLLLPVSQLLKYKIGNKSSELGDIKKRAKYQDDCSEYSTGYLQIWPSGYTTSASSTLKEQETEDNHHLILREWVSILNKAHITQNLHKRGERWLTLGICLTVWR